jgi:YYY domain-containing protein
MSEHTSPMHDPASAMEAPPRAVSLSAPRWPSIRVSELAADRARVLSLAIMALILLTGGFLRFTNADWDHHLGYRSNPNRAYDQRYLGHLHPDERFLTTIAQDTKWPGWRDYLNTDRSGLNPYNIQRQGGGRQSTFVYGTLPLFGNKLVAAYAATPYTWLEKVKLGDPVDAALGFISGGRMGLPKQAFDEYDTYALAGRWLSALTDTLTIALIFLLGRRLANRSVGLLAAGLYAFAPFPIQNAHFFIVDPYVTFFAAFTLFFTVRGAQAGGYWNFALAGLGAGLATASKTTALALVPVALLGAGVYAWPGVMPFLAPLWAGDRPAYAATRDGRKLDRSVAILILGALVTLLAAFIAYRFAMPYAFKTPSFSDYLRWNVGKLGPLPTVYPDIMNEQWLKDQLDQQNLLSGNAAFPPNVQWIARSKWLWPLQQMVSWGMGPALGITAWAGVVFAGIYAWRRRVGAWLAPLAWVLGYFGFMGTQYSLYMRYFLPLYPALAVFAAFVLYHTWRFAASREPFAWLGSRANRLSALRPVVPVALRSGVAVVIVFTVLAGLAFYNIYRSPVTRAAASCWAYQNIPEGSVIGQEHWDDTLPYDQPEPSCPRREYATITFDNFNVDSPERVQSLLANIDAIDYYIPSSRRLSGNIVRVPAIWPVTATWYETLEKDPESIGFRKVAEFTSYPRLFGLEFDDTGAEESWSVYDHPEVVIYQKTEEYSPERLRQVLGADAFVPGCKALPGDAAQNCLLYRENVLDTQRANGTWTDIFDPGSIYNRFPAVSFLLIMQLAAFSLAPLAIVVFRGLPDRGYLLTKPLGVMGLAYLVYAPSGLGATDFTRDTIAGMLAILLLIGVVTFYAWRDEVTGWVRGHWRFVLGCEAVFLAMFLFSYWLRLQNPDLYHPYNGGEKPMDFAYFNGVLRTTDLTQGPIDPWYAGGYLNYYWWGYIIGATPTKLLGIVPEVAYNLVVPMFYALAAAATFSVAYNLAEATRQLMRRRPGGLPINARGPIVAGLLAIFLVLIAGNLKAVQILFNSMDALSTWNVSLFGREVPGVSQAVTILGGFKEIIFGEATWAGLFRESSRGPGYYDWWAPSRALSIVPGEENGVTPITEFPFWTFLFADLHAHLMAIPFAMTATGVGLGAVMNFSRRLNPALTAAAKSWTGEAASWAIVLALALLVGALRWINSWDYPPFLLIGAAALILGERAKEGRFTVRALCMGVLKTAVMGVLSYALFIVVAKNYSQSYSNINQSNQTTDLTDYLSQFGVFLFLMAGLLVFQLNRAITRTGWIRGMFFGSSRWRSPLETAPVMIALVLAAGVLVWVFSLQRWGVTGLALAGLIGVALAAAHEIRSRSPAAPVMLFVYAMIALGLGLSGGVEIITLEGDVGRMNTVFKFYLHVWMMWGVASAFALWYVFGVMRPQEAFLRRLGEYSSALVLAPRYAFGAVAAVLLVMTLVYPYFGTRARIGSRFDPSLGAGNDGLAWMESDNIVEGGRENFYSVRYETSDQIFNLQLRDTRDAINWLRNNVTGTPTIIEAITVRYRSLYARMAINTGLPDVLGWDFHQSQQRVKFAYTIEERKRDVNDFYTTQDAGVARQILKRYGVGWVIVGDEERNNYGEAGMAKFDDGLGGALELAYENPSIRIYRVLPEEELQAAAAP